MKLTTKGITRFAGAALFAASTVWPARADYTSEILSHGPIAYWPFSETAPSPAPYALANSGSVGSIGDAHAVPTVTNGVSGIAGNALSFYNAVGTAHLDSHADVYYNTDLNPNVFSVEFWAKPSARTLNSSLFDSTGASPLSNINPNGSSGSRLGYLFYLSPNGQWHFWLGRFSGYAAQIDATTGLASVDTWQHIVGTYDGATARLYANGVLIASQAATGWVPNTASFLRLGGTQLVGDTPLTTAVVGNSYGYLPWNQYTTASGNRGWDGLLDEIAIYTNVLSDATVAAHYAAAATPATYGATVLADHPVGYWNFDEPAVTRPGSSAFPVATNAGSLGTDADGTNVWGTVAGQAGPGYTGFSADHKAVAFDGVNGSFNVKDAPGLHFSGNVTLAAWVRPLAGYYVHDIIEHGPDSLGAETFLRITRGDEYGDPTDYYYEVGTTEGFQNDEFYDAVQVPVPKGDLGKWVFLVGTFDGTYWNLYRNGVLVGQTEPYAYPPDNDYDTGAIDVTNAWSIGSITWSPVARYRTLTWDHNNFAGSVAEPAIFNTALSDEDVFALYNAAQVPPVITQPPVVSGPVYKGYTLSLSVLADGSPTLGYQWISNGVPTGVTTTNYVISNIGVGSYAISVVVTNAYGTNIASVNFSAADQPPFITTPPASAARFVGYPFTLSVAAGGSTPLTYYWLHDGSVVQAGSSPTYTKVASTPDAGSYSVIVSNETSINVTSAPAIVVVNPIPTGYPANAYITNVLGSGAIAYWRLGESSGTVAFDRIGGHDGVYHGTTLGRPGYSGFDADTAASFDGPDSYVGNIDGAAINFSGGNTAFTLEAWVKAPSGQSDQATIIAKGIGDSGTTRTEQFALDVSSGAYRFFTTRNGNVYEADGVTGPNDTWQHIVGVYDGQNVLGGGTNLYIYVNGVQEGSTAVPKTGPSPITSEISIGSKRTGNSPTYDGTFSGTIDEVAVYNKALDGDTILAHYASIYGDNTAPFITLQPASVTNYVGLPVTLVGGAAGSLPLSYQWYHGDAPVGDGSATLTIPSVTSDDAGEYHVNVSNGIGQTNSITNLLVVLNAPTSSPAFSDLVVHLPLTNTLVDITGRGNNGTNVNNPYFVPDGPLGLSALHYSTDSTNIGTANYVTLGVRPDLNFSSNVSFTVAFWIRLPYNYQGGDLPFFTDATGSTFNKGFVFAPTYGYFATANPETTTAVDGGWAFSVFDGSGAGVGGHGRDNQLNDGYWHHLVYVIDRAKGSVVYVDGVPSKFTKQQGTSVTAAGDIYTGAPATIGQDPTGNYGEIGYADIADLGVWRKPLTALEAASIYVAGVNSQLSFTGLPTVTIQSISSAQVQITWPSGTLQSASNVNGPYTDVPSATSPYTVNTSGSANAFYRVKK